MHFRRNRGACLFCASAYRYRDPVYKKAFADEEAEVKITTLMIDGSAGIPALTMARKSVVSTITSSKIKTGDHEPITHGDFAAPFGLPPRPCKRLGSLEATNTPIANEPST